MSPVEDSITDDGPRDGGAQWTNPGLGQGERASERATQEGAIDKKRPERAASGRL